MKKNLTFVIISISLCGVNGCGNKVQNTAPQSEAVIPPAEIKASDTTINQANVAADPVVEGCRPFKYTIDTKVETKTHECEPCWIGHNEDGDEYICPGPGEHGDDDDVDRSIYEDGTCVYVECCDEPVPEPVQETVEILVTINSMNGIYPIKYDLDCEGDGEYEYTGLTENQKCVYKSNTGNHQIWVCGDIPAMFLCARGFSQSYSCGASGYKDELGNLLEFRCAIQEKRRDDAFAHVVSIDDWGAISWKSMKGFAAYCQNLEKIPENAPNLAEVTDMSHIFDGVSRFNQPVDSWDVSHVTDMSFAFHSTHFNQPLKSWNVSRVTNMRSMFEESRFNQPIASWDVSQVIDMGKMFSETPFNQPIGSWDVSQVRNMNSMFQYAREFNQPLQLWNVSNVRDMHAMFYYCYKFDQPIESWNVSQVTDMSFMFESSNFNHPLENWDVSNVTKMDAMFHTAQFFNQPLEKWDVSHVTRMSSMFQNTKSFNQPLERWNVSSVTDMHFIFAETQSFNQPLEKWDVSNVTDMHGMFFDAISFNQPLEKWNVSNVTSMNNMFRGTKSFNQPLEMWDVSKVKDMEKMFYDAESFNQPLDEWNIINVKTMTDMFYGAKSFSYYPSSWIVPKDKPSFRGTKVAQQAKKKPLRVRK